MLRARSRRRRARPPSRPAALAPAIIIIIMIVIAIIVLAIIVAITITVIPTLVVAPDTSNSYNNSSLAPPPRPGSRRSTWRGAELIATARAGCRAQGAARAAPDCRCPPPPRRQAADRIATIILLIMIILTVILTIPTTIAIIKAEAAEFVGGGRGSPMRAGPARRCPPRFGGASPFVPWPCPVCSHRLLSKPLRLGGGRQACWI